MQFNRSGSRRTKYAPPKKKRVKKNIAAKATPKSKPKAIPEAVKASGTFKFGSADAPASKPKPKPTPPKSAPTPRLPGPISAPKPKPKPKPRPKPIPKPKPKPKPKPRPKTRPKPIPVPKTKPSPKLDTKSIKEQLEAALKAKRERTAKEEAAKKDRAPTKPKDPRPTRSRDAKPATRKTKTAPKATPKPKPAGPPTPPNVARSTLSNRIKAAVSADPGLTRKGYQDRQTLQDVTEQARRGSAPISVPSLQNIRDVAASVAPPPMVSTTSVAPPSAAPTAPSVDKPGFWQKTLQSGMDALRSVVEVAGDKLRGLDRDDFLAAIRAVSPASALLIEQGLKSIPGKSDLTQMIDDVASGKIAPRSQEKPEPPVTPTVKEEVVEEEAVVEEAPEEGTPSDMAEYLKTASPESIQARIKGYKASRRAQETRDPFLDRTTGADALTSRAAGEKIATQEQAYGGGGGMAGPAPTRPDMGGLSIITGDTVNNPGQRVAETRRAVEQGYVDPVEGQERIEEIIREEAEETPPISTMPVEPPPQPAPAPMPFPTPPPLVQVDPFEGFGSSYIPRNIIGQSFDPSAREDYEKQMQAVRARMMQPGGNIAGSEYPVHQMPIMATPQTQFGGYGQPMPTAPLLPYSGLAAPRQPFVPFSPESKD